MNSRALDATSVVFLILVGLAAVMVPLLPLPDYLLPLFGKYLCFALLDGAHAAGPHEQDELAAGHRAEEPLDQRRAEEPGRAGDRDALPVEVPGDHLACIPFGQ